MTLQSESGLAFLNRTLDQELAAIARGASLECRTLLWDGLEVPESELEFIAQAG